MVGETTGLNCRTCGAAIDLRGLTHTRTVVCSSCGTIQDPHDPTVRILQEAWARMRITPTIPLGTRGTVDGHRHDVIGFQYRTIEVEGETYGWNEYVLFNPYYGFKYLSEYDGHWNLVTPLQAIPEMAPGRTAAARYDGKRFRHFQSADATTAYVLGEFPWRVRAGDVVHTADYVAPPEMLSAERTEEETTWSHGRYVNGRDIWTMFEMPGSPPRARGIFADQPSPWAGRTGRMWRAFAVLALVLLVVLGLRLATASRKPIFSGAYSFRPGAGEPSFVTEPFAVEGSRPTTVEVAFDTDLSNNWTYFNVALVNMDTGSALDFGKEVSYYFGRDSDGNWTEGSRRGAVRVPSVDPGSYYLRVEPEADAGSRTAVRYRLSVREDVPTWWPYLVVLGLLAIPPVLVTMRAASFETKRWQESDHAG
jgi:hypothetical protein